MFIKATLTWKNMRFNCVTFWIAVLHTGKRWFIICPVEETPSSALETPSEGTATQSPGSSATTQPADSGTARPPRGNFVPAEPFQHFSQPGGKQHYLVAAE